MKDAGLRGRGGAGFPGGLKWTFLPKDHPGPIYLCVNADESEPGTFNNRILMEEDPHQVLEGIVIACYAIRSHTAYLYLRYEYGRSYRVLDAAIDECYAAGLLGKNILGSGFDLDIYLHRGAGAYICGEETGLIESLEGKRAWPRIKPPFPAVEGAVPQADDRQQRRDAGLRDAHPATAASTGSSRSACRPIRTTRATPGSYGPKLYCISGHVNKPGCVELPLGITARELIDEHGGGVWKGRKAKAVVPGGISMGFLTAAELDTPLDFDGPGKVGCLGLGTAAVVVIDDQTSMVDVLYNSCRFFAHESCGQCTPCREGTALDDARSWTASAAAEGGWKTSTCCSKSANSMGIMPGTTICGLADGAAWPVKNAIRSSAASSKSTSAAADAALHRPTH